MRTSKLPLYFCLALLGPVVGQNDVTTRFWSSNVEINFQDVYDNTFEPTTAMGQLFQEILDIVFGSIGFATMMAPYAFDGAEGGRMATDDRNGDREEADRAGDVSVFDSIDLRESYAGAFDPNNGLANALQNVVDFIASAIAWLFLIYINPVIVNSFGRGILKRNKRMSGDEDRDDNEESMFNVENAAWLLRRLSETAIDYHEFYNVTCLLYTSDAADE